MVAPCCIFLLATLPSFSADAGFPDGAVHCLAKVSKETKEGLGSNLRSLRFLRETPPYPRLGAIGSFVLTGGEIAAMAVVEAVVRLLPGVLGNADSVEEESFSPACDGLLEYPQFTRPASFRGFDVPHVLKSGDHERVAAYRRSASIARTAVRRPDLVAGRALPRASKKGRS